MQREASLPPPPSDVEASEQVLCVCVCPADRFNTHSAQNICVIKCVEKMQLFHFTVSAGPFSNAHLIINSGHPQRILSKYSHIQQDI